MKSIFSLIVVLAIAACANGGPTPKAAVVAIQGGISSADTIALGYVALPLCDQSGVKSPCADRSILINLDKARAAAKIAADQADKTVNDPAFDQSKAQAAIVAAQNALAAFQQIVATLPKGN